MGLEAGGAVYPAGRPASTYTNTLSSVPFALTITSSLVGAVGYFPLHTGSSLMSIFAITGFVPVNLIDPEIVAPAGARSARRPATPSATTAAASVATTPSVRIIPPRSQEPDGSPGEPARHDTPRPDAELADPARRCARRTAVHPRPSVSTIARTGETNTRGEVGVSSDRKYHVLTATREPPSPLDPSQTKKATGIACPVRN